VVEARPAEDDAFMSFQVAAESYDRFMGRFSQPLAPAFADFVGVRGAETVLDVGAGPGALTGALLDRAETVTAADPSPPFVEALRDRFPDVSVVEAPAERLPFATGAYDATLAQLVVHFMSDPQGGVREMARVTRPGGPVGACVWDHGGGGGPLSDFWAVARTLDPRVRGEADLMGTREGQLGDLFVAAGLQDVVAGRIAVTVRFATFDEWWEPYLLGVGPAGDHVAGLSDDGRNQLREACVAALPDAPFELEAVAWTARGTVR
jgi:SAM-dependent methyltransferase